VAVMQGNGIWPMFFFGLAGIFVITQMHGLGLSFRVRAALLALFCTLALYIYSDRGWVQMNEIIRIPLIDYISVFILAGIFWLVLKIASMVRERRLRMAER
jgi:hypothetical protein